jgi:hypothetical protein
MALSDLGPFSQLSVALAYINNARQRLAYTGADKESPWTVLNEAANRVIAAQPRFALVEHCKRAFDNGQARDLFWREPDKRDDDDWGCFISAPVSDPLADRPAHKGYPGTVR